MQLYWYPGSCSLAPHIVLHAIGAEFDPVKVDLFTKTLENGESYLAINPHGALPALGMDNGEVLTEAAVILQYLADLKPEAELVAPAGSLERYRQQESLNYLASDIHKAFSILVNPTAPDDFKATIRSQLTDRLAQIDAGLQHEDYLCGGRFSIADCYLFVITNWSAYAAVDLSPFQALNRYRERIGSMAAVQAAMKAEGLI
ncbi:glutathione transferase GstA [Sphingobium estronivorans]|uniref:glutathione transferase GstA n=1 Tax=Sphingobium estronivorans TaxID=1577690 RepID=UPI0013C342EB|nr:glutathione transferase GstA [Sphingobium estronivorans]